MAEQLGRRVRRALRIRQENGLLRTLRPPAKTAADFSSNDYLGFSRPGPFQEFLAHSEKVVQSRQSSGATGSRLLSGHSEEVAELEQHAARFHHSEASLLFNSGYDANLSVLSCLPGSSDAIIYDELIHASVHDGMRMGRARSNLIPFRHNCLLSLSEELESAVSSHDGSVLICIETVYSMDGDVAPLREMLTIAERTQEKTGREVYVVADEAHAGGLYGANGEGLAVFLRVESHRNLLARVVTFGKAFAAHGAVVLSSSDLKQYLVNYARPFIYSTALPPHSIAVLMAVYDFSTSQQARQARNTLWRNVAYFRSLASEKLPANSVLPVAGKSPIQGVLVPGNPECVALSQVLRQLGFDVYPIRSPTVSRGSERIRIIIHTHNTDKQILGLVESIGGALREAKSTARL